MNKFFSKLPFKGLAEKFIPVGARAKVPLLDSIVIPFANQIVVALIAVIVLSACFGGGGGGGKSAYYGTWKDSTDFGFEISANKLSRFDHNGNILWTMENLTWLPIDNTDRQQAINYPKGMEILGVDNRGWTYPETFYIHNNGASFIHANMEYRKQR